MQTTADPLARTYRHFLHVFTQHPADTEGFDPEQVAAVRELTREKTLVFLAFPPKSGGTFLRDAVGRILALRGPMTMLRGSFIPAGDQEQDLYFPGLLGHFIGEEDRVGLIHNHPVATSGNRALIDLFGMKPIVMRRPILDMLRSRYDQAQKLGYFGGHGSGLPPTSFLELPLELQKDFLIYNVAPWFVKFYASWFQAADAGLDVRFLSFEEFRQDNAGTVREILAINGISAVDDEIDQALGEARAQRDQLRFNKGVSGRGEAFFDDGHKEHVERLVQAYVPADPRWEGLS